MNNHRKAEIIVSAFFEHLPDDDDILSVVVDVVEVGLNIIEQDGMAKQREACSDALLKTGFIHKGDSVYKACLNATGESDESRR